MKSKYDEIKNKFGVPENEKIITLLLSVMRFYQS